MARPQPSKRACIDLAAEGWLQGVFTGAAFGLFMALHQRRLHPEPNAVRQVLHSFGHSVLLFSSLLAVYHGCTCIASHARGRDDLLNAAIGGAAAGLVVTLPSRQPRLMAQNALGMACVGGLMDRISHPTVQAAAAARPTWRQRQWQSNEWRSWTAGAGRWPHTSTKSTALQ